MSDKNLALMRQMGATTYDPIPPDQYLVFLEAEMVLSERGQRGLAWLRLKTIHADDRKRRWAWAHDTRGDLRLSHMATDLGIEQPHASIIWSELEESGFGRRDEKGRLCLCGEIDVEAKKTRTKPKDSSSPFLQHIRTNMFFAPVVQYFQSLDEKERDNASRRYLQELSDDLKHHFESMPERERIVAQRDHVAAVEYARHLEAHAIAAARLAGTEMINTVCQGFGFEDEETRGRTPLERQSLVELRPVAFETFRVQISFDGMRTDNEKPSYTKKNGSVRKSHPYAHSEQKQRVSEERPDVENSASEPKEDAPAARSTAATTPPAAPPKPQSEKGVNASESPVLKTVAEILGRPIAARDPLFQLFAQLPAEFDIPPHAVCWFLDDLRARKRAAHYEIHSPGALYKMASEDLPLWIKQNWRKIEASMSAEERARRQGRGAAGGAS